MNCQSAQVLLHLESGWEKTYPTVKTQDMVILEDMDKSTQHAFRPIRCASLKADLQAVSSYIVIGAEARVARAMKTHLDYNPTLVPRYCIVSLFV